MNRSRPLRKVNTPVKQLLPDGADDLEALLSVPFPDRGDDQLIGILENPMPNARTARAFPVDVILGEVKPIGHEQSYTGIPYERIA